MAPLDFTPSDKRGTAVDWSPSYGNDNIVILSPAPKIAVQPWLLLQIFSPLVGPRGG